MKNKINDLRNHLFETLEALKDDEKPMDVARARTIADVAKVIVESAKVEVSFLKVTGALSSTDFLPVDGGETPARPQLLPGRPVTPQGKRVTA
jgi:hypothetical protein